MIAVQKSCIHASAAAVFVEWWIVVFVDNVSFHRGICTLGASLTRDCSSDDEHRDCSQPGWYCSRKSFSVLKACEHATRLLTRLVTSTITRDFKRDVSFVYIPLCHENLALVTRRSPRTSGPRDYVSQQTLGL